MAQKLLDFSIPLDITLLDSTVAEFYGTGSKDIRAEAETVLKALQDHPDSWTRVVPILQQSQRMQTKYFAVQILEPVIKYRWNALPVDQRDGMKNFISDLIVRLSSDERTFRSERVYVNKLDFVLVQVLKHEWPHRWPSFVSDLVGAAQSSESVCENCMVIMKLLSEEVFDFSAGEMTQLKTKEMKESLNSEFEKIHGLCMFVLTASQRPELISATLSTLHAFLGWIPLKFIFTSNLLEILLNLLAVHVHRNKALQCLTEVAGLSFDGDQLNSQYLQLYAVFMDKLRGILPVTLDIREAHRSGSSEDQDFVQNLALFLSSFYKNHLEVLQASPDFHPILLEGIEYLINISYVDDNEILKVCLDYWQVFVGELYRSVGRWPTSPLGTSSPSDQGHEEAEAMGLNLNLSLDGSSAHINGNGHGQPGMSVVARASLNEQLRQLYAEPLSKLRLLLICRMAKPEEVLVVEDENGNVVRVSMQDSDVLLMYKLMREMLVYLCHLDHDDTEQQMLRKLSRQVTGEEWSWSNLNTLCWAIGSISGSMQEDQENRFLVTVIRDLLNLCECMKGKDNKAIIASNIMYVVGQYPRFLRAHWKFLKTVVQKLFEFMHETHPGVQDMACDTFLKIVQKCRRKFVITQVGEACPFVAELVGVLPSTIHDLQPQHIHTFFEAVGCMIEAETDTVQRDSYLKQLMGPPNMRWTEIIAQARENVEVLRNPEIIKEILNILQTNSSVASAMGRAFFSQITFIFLDMMAVYKMYSELISSQVAAGGPFAAKSSLVKLLRSVKREALNLIGTFLDRCSSAQLDPESGKDLVLAMMDPVLGDYARNLPDAREAEVLSLFATVISKLGPSILAQVPQIFEAVFECTLSMITTNFEDYPEHRLRFFSLLKAIATHCFSAMLKLSEAQLNLVMESIVWAIRHTERNVAETGLVLLQEVISKFQSSELCNQFFQSYYARIEQEIFTALTDTFHKPGFKNHVIILQQLFQLADSEYLSQPLWDVAQLGPAAFPSNGLFVRSATVDLLCSSFPNLTKKEVTLFVAGMFEAKMEDSVFKNHIRDFLVHSKEFSNEDNKELFAEEAAAQREAEMAQMLAVPGLVAPVSRPDNGMLDS